jgi:hypothetical protein
MSVLSRVLIAGLACASLGAAAHAQETASSGARLGHASKCVLTLGFGGGCDSKEPVSKAEKSRQEAARRAEVTKASVETGPPSTRAEFLHASKCVATLGFGGGCDSKEPPAPSAERAEAAPDTSTRGRFFHASKCVVTLGFGNRCDRGDAR